MILQKKRQIIYDIWVSNTNHKQLNMLLVLYLVYPTYYFVPNNDLVIIMNNSRDSFFIEIHRRIDCL